MLKQCLKCTLLSLVFATNPPITLAAVAELPIRGGLGVEFGESLDLVAYGAEIAYSQHISHTALPDNRSMVMPQYEPGAVFPWRYLNQVVQPHPLRNISHESYVMLNHENVPIRLITRVAHKGCDEKYAWLQATLQKKYQVMGESSIEPKSGYEKALRITFVDKQIDVTCGQDLVIAYLDFAALRRWAIAQHKRYEIYQRNDEGTAKRQIILHRRRSEQFANAFTMGDRYTLDGAFGVYFRQPFAKNSTQIFPFDLPFFAVLPNLPTAFAQGDVQLVISPDRHPIIIRGTFQDLAFEKVREALRSKYGTPLKSTDRHVIHKVSDKHAILKRLALDTIELAFIDTKAQTDQRKRLWENESEGL